MPTNVITILPGQTGQGMGYDVKEPAPYPFHIDTRTGECVRGRGTSDLLEAPVGRPWRLVGFQHFAEAGRLDLSLDAFASEPAAAIAMFPIFDAAHATFCLREPVTGYVVHGDVDTVPDLEPDLRTARWSQPPA
ncbi:MAG TPA: hypothetical protein VGC04_02085 [Cellulomonas sp.]